MFTHHLDVHVHKYQKENYKYASQLIYTCKLNYPAGSVNTVTELLFLIPLNYVI